MKYITLTRGKRAIVDDEDYDWLNQWKWYAKEYKRKNTTSNWYACRGKWENKKMKTIRMHREILGDKYKNGEVTDHANGNGLDNQRRNLRICSVSDNTINSIVDKGGSSRYRGVQWCKQKRKWIARITIFGKRKYLGRFVSEKNAAIAFNNAAMKYHGEFACINEI